MSSYKYSAGFVCRLSYGAGDAAGVATSPSNFFCANLIRFVLIWLELGEICANLGKIWAKMN